MNKPTAAEVRSEPAGRRLDAWVAWAMNPGSVIEERPRVDGGVWYSVKMPDGRVVPRGDYSASWAAAGPLLESWWSQGSVVFDYGGNGVHELYLLRKGLEAGFCTFDPAKPNDLCRAISVARILAALEIDR